MELGELVRWAGGLLLGGFLAVIVWKVLTDQINIDGVLETRDSSGQLVRSPVRLQMLLISLLVAVQYISEVIHHPSSSLPSPSPQMLYLLGGSQALHVGRKAYTELIQPMLTGSDGERK